MLQMRKKKKEQIQFPFGWWCCFSTILWFTSFLVMKKATQNENGQHITDSDSIVACHWYGNKKPNTHFLWTFETKSTSLPSICMKVEPHATHKHSKGIWQSFRSFHMKCEWMRIPVAQANIQAIAKYHENTVI